MVIINERTGQLTEISMKEYVELLAIFYLTREMVKEVHAIDGCISVLIKSKRWNQLSVLLGDVEMNSQ